MLAWRPFPGRPSTPIDLAPLASSLRAAPPEVPNPVKGEAGPLRQPAPDKIADSIITSWRSERPAERLSSAAAPESIRVAGAAAEPPASQDRDPRSIPNRAVVVAVEPAKPIRGDGGMAPDLSAKGVVLQQASYFQPLFPAAQQLASAILTNGLAQTDQAAGSAPSGFQPSAPHGREPLKVLEIALDPADLGTVTVRMHLAGDALRLHVTAERSETAALLDRDRDRLAKVLHAAGYKLDAVSLHIETSRSAESGGNGTGTQTQGQQSQFEPQSSAQGRAGDERSQRHQPQQKTFATMAEGSHAERDLDGLRARGGDLYV
jgi:flagellar hook-length control protein FliK